MQILVRSLEGKTVVVKLGKNPTLGVLKSAVSAEELCAAGDLRLLYNGKELSDEKKALSEFGIFDGSFVNANGKLRGGCDGEELERLNESLKRLEEALKELNEC